MTLPLWRVRILLCWTFSVFLSGAFAAARADSPPLTAVFGIGGRYRPGAWCPVTVTLRNPTSDSRTGQVQVLASSDSNQGRNGMGGNRALGAALFGRPVTLAANPNPQSFQLYTRGMDTGRDSVTVQFAEGQERGDGRVLAQANTQDTKTSGAITGTPVTDNDLLLVGFGGDPSAFTALNGRSVGLLHTAGGVKPFSNAPPPNVPGMGRQTPMTPPQGTLQVAEASGGELPDKAAGYGGVDAFLLRSDAPLDGLTEAQADALKGWVASGGHLIVCGGVDAGRFASSFFNGLLPATVGPARSGVTMPGAGAVGALTLTPKPLPGVHVTSSTTDGTPLTVSGPFGAGVVTLAAYDPTAKSFQTAAANETGMWQNLLTTGPASSAAVLPYVAAREENYHPNSYGGNEISLLSDAVMRGASLDAPGTEVIGLFLLVYLLCLVPVNYLILKRFDRKELAWVTIPAVVVLFAVGTFSVGYAAKGGSVFLNRAAVVETSAGRREAGVYAELGLFSPHRTTYDINLPGANALAAIPNPGVNFGFRGGSSNDTQSYGVTKFVQTSEGASLLDTSVNMWAMRAFDFQATEDLGGTIDAVLTPQNGAPLSPGVLSWGVTGTVTNHTSHAFTDCVIIYNGQAIPVGSLASGATVPVTLGLLASKPAALLGLPLQINHTEPLDNSEIHLRMKVALADYARSLGDANTNNYYNNNGMPNQGPMAYAPSPNEALLLGWSEDSTLAGPAPRIDGHSVHENDVTLLIVHLPLPALKAGH